MHDYNENGVRNDFSKQYLHYIHYEEDNEIENVNERKVNVIREEIISLNERLEKRAAEIQKGDQEIEEKINEVY